MVFSANKKIPKASAALSNNRVCCQMLKYGNIIKAGLRERYQQSSLFRPTNLYTIYGSKHKKAGLLRLCPYKYLFYCYLNILSTKAKTTFCFVSILHCLPCSIRVMVVCDILAFLASSALLIIRYSLIFLKEFLLIAWALYSSSIKEI